MTARLNISLVSSTGIHLIMVVILFFITLSYQTRLPKLIEVSLIELPSQEIEIKEEVKKEEVYPERRPIRITRSKHRFERVKKEILPAQSRPEAIKPQQEPSNQRIDSPVQLPNSGGLKEERPIGDLPAVVSPSKGEIVQKGEEEGKEVIASPPQPQKDKLGGEQEVVEGRDIDISGPARSREAVYQPKFSVPEWIERKGQPLSGRFKFWVLPDGSIDRVEIQKPFGYAELDTKAISTIYRWRFNKLFSSETKTDWGVATIKIRLE